MGMYTALSLGVQLKWDEANIGAPCTSPRDVLEYLTTGRREIAAEEYADQSMHPFFSCYRWPMVLRCDSYYFDWQSGYQLEYDNIASSYFLTGVANLKNYGNEINLFLDWLRPMIETYGFIGWKMYEEDVSPTLLFYLGKEDEGILEQLPTRSQETLFEGLTPIKTEV